MRTMVLRVIAEPPQIFWAPILPAAGNALLNITLMMFGVVVADLNPLPFFVTLVIGHGIIAGYAVRDPHLSTLITAWSESKRKTTNLIPVKGNKYVA